MTAPTVPYASLAQIQVEAVARIPRVGARGALTGTSDTTVYTAPAVTTNSPNGSNFATAVITSLMLHNTDSTARAITAHIVESGGSVADNRECYSFDLAANETYVHEFAMGLPLHPGEFVSLKAGTADTITYRVHVEEFPR